MSLSEVQSVANEARRMVDETCGVNESYEVLAERTRRYEAALLYQSYRRAIAPYVDLKCRLTMHLLPSYLLVGQPDGPLKLESREALIPQETRDTLAKIDEIINEIAADYMRPPPIKLGGNLP